MSRKQAKMQQVEESCFVLYYEGKPIHLVKPGYNAPRPSKRVYWTEGHAKSGIHHLPEWIDKTKVEIVEYRPFGHQATRAFVIQRSTEYAEVDNGPIVDTTSYGDHVYWSEEEAMKEIQRRNVTEVEPNKWVTSFRENRYRHYGPSFERSAYVLVCPESEENS